VLATSALLPLWFLFFSGFSLPLGLPPLPEDPVIGRVAPEECLGYVSWAGTATPDAKSANQTEQLLAEPEVQKLLSAIDSAIGAGIEKSTHGVENTKDVYSLVKTLLTRPAAVFLSKVEVTPHGPPNFEGGAIVNLAEKTTSVGDSLERIEKLMPPDTVEKVELAGVSFHRIKSAGMPPITWGLHGKYLIVGLGDGAVEGILKRAKGQPPAWLTAVRKRLPVERQSNMIYINVKQVVAQFAPLGGPKVPRVLDAIGLGNVNYLASVTGLDGKRTVARTLIATDGQPQGVFHLAAAKPLSAADLSPIPRDATIAAAGRLDANAALELLLAQIEKIDPAARANVTQGMGKIAKELGIDVQQDLLKPLGDVWCVYNSPAEGGLLVTGLTGVVQVRDHDRLQATLDKLTAPYRDSVEPSAAKEEIADRDMHNSLTPRLIPRIRKTVFGGQTIYHFELRDAPLAPAWCLTEKELIASTFPQNIKSYLTRGKDFQSLAAVPDVAHALEGRTVALNYCDMRKVAEFAYPLLCVGGSLISSKLSREGIPLDASLMPSAAAIFPHLQPSIGVVRGTADGIEFESRGTLNGIGVGPVLPTMVLFFVRAPRVQTLQSSAEIQERQRPIKQGRKPISYPYFATKERSDQIRNNYESIQLGMTPEQVKVLLGEPDETQPLFEPNIKNAKQVGNTHWFLIQRKTDKGSVNAKDEKLVRISYDLNGKVTRVDHWGFDERKR